MIYTASHVQKDLHLEADLCVIGTGAGGSPVILEAVKQGKKVIAVEAGSFWRPKDFTQLEHDMFPKLYHDKAGRTTQDKAIQVHQGKGVGGSTLHNINLCGRVPKEVYEEWKQDVGLSRLPWEKLQSLYQEIEEYLPVTKLTESELSKNNQVLKKGCEKLGYKGDYLKHNRKGCAQSGFCELGCAFDAKQNALKRFIAPAVAKGAVILADTWAYKLNWEGRKATSLEAWVRDPTTGKKQHPVTIKAKAFCVSASGTTSAAILMRSGIPDPHSLFGSKLFLHPGAAVAGVFPEKLEAWRGIPQSYECTEFLDFSKGSEKRIWILPVFAHPVGVSSILSEFGAKHEEYLKLYPYMASISAMIHDTTCGSVKPTGEFGVSIDYWMNASDRKQLKLGLKECTRILLAAGAKKVLVPFYKTIEVTDAKQLDEAFSKVTVDKFSLVINSVHPMGSVWMGDSPKNSCVTTEGKCHHMDNVFVSDTSLFPGSIGVPPQISAYSLGLHIGRHISKSVL